MPNSDKSLPVLPDSVSPVPDHFSASTFNFDYYLDDGKIYIRSRTPEDPKALVLGELVSIKDAPDALEWKLFDDIGVPYDAEKKSLLAPDEQIVEISVGSDIVVAVSNFGLVYLYKPTEKTKPFKWESRLGAPDLSSDKLYLPHERRAWSFSCSVRTKPEIRRTDFMHPNEIVMFFSDANGINFDFGFTPTVYVLDRDGLKIVYWDTGLPASFSRGFLVPDGTQGQSISAAGSTVFLSVTDSEGRLHFYTRMIDYEINGACPGLDVSYTNTTVVQPPSGPEGSFFLGQGVRKLPLRGWVEHPVDDIIHNLTHKVCIRLTGQGDTARELRIQGNDPELGWGYYSKKIAESEWVFNPDPAVAPVDFMEPIKFPYNPSFPETQKLSYTGKLFTTKFPCPKVEDTSEVTLEIKDFHPFLTDAEPFSLRLSHPDEPSQDLKIHAVDAWGLHYHNYNDEYLVGAVDGEPKALIGTLVLTPEQIELAQNANSVIGVYLKDHFLAQHGKTKAIRVIGDNGMAIVKFGNTECNFSRSITEQEKVCSFYMRKAMNRVLTLMPENAEECASLLAKNKDCLNQIQSIFSKRRIVDGKYVWLNINTSIIRPIVSGFFKLFVRPKDPTYKQAIEDINLLFRAHREATAYSMLGKTHAVGYELAVVLLTYRIEMLEAMSENFERSSMALH